MKQIFIILITLTFFNRLTSTAQTINYFTKKFITPNNGNGYGTSISTDLNCYVYVTSASEGIGSGFDYLTVKYDMNGDTVWSRRYNGPANSNDYPVMIKVDASGNVYVTGKSIGISSAYDYATIKYNAMGAEQWTKRFNNSNPSGNGDDIPVGVLIDANNANIYVGGYSNNYANPTSLNDYVLIKYDAISGNEVWNTPAFYDSFGSDQIATAMSMTNTEIFIVGYDPNNIFTTNEISAQFNTSGVATNYTASTSITADISIDGSNNVYIYGKYDPTVASSLKVEKYQNTFSNQSWFSIYAVTPQPYNMSNQVSAAKIIATNNGVYGIANVGFYSGSLSYDVFAFKLNTITGDTIWTKRIINPGNDWAYSMALDANENIYYTGYVTVAGNKDIIINKLDPNNGNNMAGFPIYFNGIPNMDDEGKAIAVTPIGYFLTGFTTNANSIKDLITLKNVYFLAQADAGLDDTICTGNNIQIGATSNIGYTYEWSPINDLSSAIISNPIASPTNSTVYVVTAIAGCTMGKDTMELTVFPSPPIPIISVNGLILSSNSINNNQWYQNGTLLSNDTLQSLTVTQYGVYTVVVTNSFGCSSTSLPFEYFPVGINNVIKVNGFEIAPNPCSTCNLFCNTGSETDFVIYDAIGRKTRFSLVKNSEGFSIIFDENIAGMFLIKNIKTGDFRKIYIE